MESSSPLGEENHKWETRATQEEFCVFGLEMRYEINRVIFSIYKEIWNNLDANVCIHLQLPSNTQETASCNPSLGHLSDTVFVFVYKRA